MIVLLCCWNVNTVIEAYKIRKASCNVVVVDGGFFASKSEKLASSKPKTPNKFRARFHKRSRPSERLILSPHMSHSSRK